MREKIYLFPDNTEHAPGGFYAEHIWGEGGGKRFFLGNSIGYVPISEALFIQLKREAKLNKKR